MASLFRKGPDEGVDTVGANELEQISVLDLIIMHVRLRARRRIAWLQHLWGERVPEAAHIEAGLDNRDTPWAEADWYSNSGLVDAENCGVAHIEELLSGEAGSHLRQLETFLGLSAQESGLLQTCLANALDPNLGAVFACLNRNAERNYVTGPLVSRLFGFGRQAVWRATSPLAIWGLVQEVESSFAESKALRCDPDIVHWLQGNLEIDSRLIGAVRDVPQREPLDSWPVKRIVQCLRRSIERDGGTRVVLEGPPGSGRKTLAAAVGVQFGVPTLAYDTGRISDEDWPESYMRALRFAILAGTAVVWHGAAVQRLWPTQVSATALQFVVCEEDEVISPHADLIDHRFVMPNTTLEERSVMWVKHVPESAAWPEAERVSLIQRHRMLVGEIVGLGRRFPASAREASAVCREMTRNRLGEYGNLLSCPFSWHDLVLPQSLRAALEDFAYEATERSVFWENDTARRLFPRGTALIGLLVGPPGTGKTMAAQVIAANLDLDLFRIDLATVVSKYIGETAKNLRRIFARAARMNAVLLFDEADALFSKRTNVRDSHDRYANADTNYLLQLIEEYTGIALLATNKKNNIDPAFTRRVRYVLNFPRPSAQLRRTIWNQVIAELSDEETSTRLAGVIDRLSLSADATGAQIKNSVLASLFIARRDGGRLEEHHLLQGLERELNKEGRSLGRYEQEAVVNA